MRLGSLEIDAAEKIIVTQALAHQQRTSEDEEESDERLGDVDFRKHHLECEQRK